MLAKSGFAVESSNVGMLDFFVFILVLGLDGLVDEGCWFSLFAASRRTVVRVVVVRCMEL